MWRKTQLCFRYMASLPELSSAAPPRRHVAQTFQYFGGNKQEIRGRICCAKVRPVRRRSLRLWSFWSQHRDPPLVIVFGNLTHFFFPWLFASTACGRRQGRVKTKSRRGEALNVRHEQTGLISTPRCRFHAF